MATIKEDIIQTQSDLRATANGAAIDVSAYRALQAALVATLTGAPTSPTLDISMQTSNDGTNWFALPTAWAFSQKTASATEYKIVPADTFGRYVRFVYTVGGSGYAQGSKYWSTTINLVGSK